MTTNVPWLALWSDCLWSSCCSPLTERRPRPALFAQQGVSIKHEMKYQLRLYTGHNSLLMLVLLGTLLIFLNKILDPLVRIGSWAILFGSGNIDPRYIGSPVEHEISMFGCLTTLLFSEENPGDVLHNSFSTLDFFGTCDRLVVHEVSGPLLHLCCSEDLSYPALLRRLPYPHQQTCRPAQPPSPGPQSDGIRAISMDTICSA